MNVNEEKICRLCLRVAENDFKIIDELTRNVLEDLLLRVNLDISKDPIICKNCAEDTKKCFHFKSVCNNIEESLLSSITDTNRATLELKHIFKNGKDIETVDGHFICQFCSNHLSESNLILLETLMNDVKFVKILKVLMSQTDFHIIKNSLICTSCKQDLECYIKFVENCLEVEEEITKYIQNEGIPFYAQVKLSEIFYFKNILKPDDTQMYTIKQEKDALEDIDVAHSDIHDSKLIKTEEVNIKVEQVDFSEIGCGAGSEIPYGNSEMALFENSSFTPTMADYRKCMCDTAQSCCIKCESPSNEISSGTSKEYRTKHEYEVNKKTENNLKAQIFKCAMCTFQSKQKNNIKRHMLTHEGVEMYKCSMCSFETRYKDYVKQHMLIHKDVSEVGMYKCSMCTYQAKKKNCFKSHMLIHKDITEVEMYKCSMCTFETRYKDYVKRHMLTHKDIIDVEMYKCSMCTYKSRHNYQLKAHMLIHKDKVEMYKCLTCTFETKHKRNLKNHMLIHKDVTQLEMYNCSMCTFETKHKCYLKTHMLLHKDVTEVKMYKCSMCTYETRLKGRLKGHMLSHKDITDVKMYKCSICTFETRYKTGVKKHMLIHKDITEVEMYKCAMCTYQSKHKSGLKGHIQRHHRSGNV